MNWLLAVISLLIVMGICYISYLLRDDDAHYFDDDD
jgi:hypothetical protein